MLGLPSPGMARATPPSMQMTTGPSEGPTNRIAPPVGSGTAFTGTGGVDASADRSGRRAAYAAGCGSSLWTRSTAQGAIATSF